MLYGVDGQRSPGRIPGLYRTDLDAETAFDAELCIDFGIQEAFLMVLHGDAASGAGRGTCGAAAAVVRV